MTAKGLRKLLLDWRAIDGDGGPGTRTDHRGSWHLFCHLAAAAALYRLPDRRCAWVGILYDEVSRRYFASLAVSAGVKCEVLAMRSRAAHDLIRRAELRGYLEGASRGHILDRRANDPGDPKRDDRRQDYDRKINSPKDGGPVWEMWTVSRDIRANSRLGSSVIEAYGELLALLGGPFAAVVARGRMEPEYGHLRQMCAMIDAGLISPEAALADIDAIAIPSSVERILLRATPEAFAQAAALLIRSRREPCYFMYGRKVSSFASASLLRRLVITLGSEAKHLT